MRSNIFDVGCFVNPNSMTEVNWARFKFKIVDNVISNNWSNAEFSSFSFDSWDKITVIVNLPR